MANNINFNINAYANFSQVETEISKLKASIATLQSKPLLGTSGKQTADEIQAVQKRFDQMILSTRAFNLEMVKATDHIEQLGSNLERGKLGLHQYYQLWKNRNAEVKNQLNDLADSQARVAKSFVIPDALRTGYSRVITNINADLKTLGATQEAVNIKAQALNSVIRGMGTELINLGKNTQWTGRQLTVGLTVPMMAFGAAASKSFRDVDKELTRMVKVYGEGLQITSEKTIGEIRKQTVALANELASAYGIAAQQTAATAADLAATGLQGQELIKSTREVMRLAALGEVDQQTAIKATIALQRTFKLSTDETAKAVDFLNAVENQTSTSMSDLVEALPRASNVIDQLGGSYKDLAAMMVALREAGVPAAEGANAIKSAMASLINPSTKAAESFTKFGINIKDITNRNAGNLLLMIKDLQVALDQVAPQDKARLIENLFGKFQFAKITALINNLGRAGSQTEQVFRLSMASSTQLAALSKAELDKMANSVTGRYNRAIEKFKAQLLPLGEQFTKWATKAMNIFSGFLEILNKFAPLKNILVGALGGAAIVGPILMLSGLFVNLIGSLIKGANMMRMFRDGFKGIGTDARGLKGAFAGVQNYFEQIDISSLAAAKNTDMLGTNAKNATQAFAILNREIEKLRINILDIAGHPITPYIPNQNYSGMSQEELTALKLYEQSSKQQGGERPHYTSKAEALKQYMANPSMSPALQAIEAQYISQHGAEEGSKKFRQYFEEGQMAQYGMVPQGSAAGLLQRRYGTENVIYGPQSGVTQEEIFTRETQRLIDIHDEIIRGKIKNEDLAAEELTRILGTSSMKGEALTAEQTSALQKIIAQVTFAEDQVYKSLVDNLVAQKTLFMGSETAIEELNADIKRIMTTGEFSTRANRIAAAWQDFINTLSVDAIREINGYRSLITSKVSSASNPQEALMLGRNIEAEIALAAQGRSKLVAEQLGPGETMGAQRLKSAIVGFPKETRKLQSGGSAWVPGSGDGDKVPAMLEPGEFVVNKNAAKQYGGFLHDINFNKAPRFQFGGGTLSSSGLTDPMELFAWARSQGFKTKSAGKYHTTSNPVSALSRIIRQSQGWNTIDSERDIIKSILLSQGYTEKQIQNALNISAAHLEKEFENIGGYDYKIWRGSNLTPDLQIYNQLAEEVGMMSHPKSKEDFDELIKRLEKYSGSSKYAEAALAGLRQRFSVDPEDPTSYINYASSSRERLSKVPGVGITASIWRKIFAGRYQSGGGIPGFEEGGGYPEELKKLVNHWQQGPGRIRNYPKRLSRFFEFFEPIQNAMTLRRKTTLGVRGEMPEDEQIAILKALESENYEDVLGKRFNLTSSPAAYTEWGYNWLASKQFTDKHSSEERQLTRANVEKYETRLEKLQDLIKLYRSDNPQERYWASNQLQMALNPKPLNEENLEYLMKLSQLTLENEKSALRRLTPMGIEPREVMLSRTFQPGTPLLNVSAINPNATYMGERLMELEHLAKPGQAQLEAISQMWQSPDKIVGGKEAYDKLKTTFPMILHFKKNGGSIPGYAFGGSALERMAYKPINKLYEIINYLKMRKLLGKGMYHGSYSGIEDIAEGGGKLLFDNPGGQDVAFGGMQLFTTSNLSEAKEYAVDPYTEADIPESAIYKLINTPLGKYINYPRSLTAQNVGILKKQNYDLWKMLSQTPQGESVQGRTAEAFQKLGIKGFFGQRPTLSGEVPSDLMNSMWAVLTSPKGSSLSTLPGFPKEESMSQFALLKTLLSQRGGNKEMLDFFKSKGFKFQTGGLTAKERKQALEDYIGSQDPKWEGSGRGNSSKQFNSQALYMNNPLQNAFHVLLPNAKGSSKEEQYQLKVLRRYMKMFNIKDPSQLSRGMQAALTEMFMVHRNSDTRLITGESKVVPMEEHSSYGLNMEGPGTYFTPNLKYSDESWSDYSGDAIFKMSKTREAFRNVARSKGYLKTDNKDEMKKLTSQFLKSKKYKNLSGQYDFDKNSWIRDIHSAARNVGPEDQFIQWLISKGYQGIDGGASVITNWNVGRKGITLSPFAISKDYLKWTEWGLDNPELISKFIKKQPNSKVGYQTGGSPWVPGSGEGDRVPAMLEPGEFVVNKNAAKQYGGLLHHLNFNAAPRFATGGGVGGGTSKWMEILSKILDRLDGTTKDLSSSVRKLSPEDQRKWALGAPNPLEPKGLNPLEKSTSKISNLFNKVSDSLKNPQVSMTGMMAGQLLGPIAGQLLQKAAGENKIAQGALGMGQMGFQMGSTFGPLGMAIGAAGGAAIGGITSWLGEQKQKAKDATDALRLSTSLGADALQMLGVKITDFSSAVVLVNNKIPKKTKIQKVTEDAKNFYSADTPEKQNAIKNLTDALKDKDTNKASQQIEQLYASTYMSTGSKDKSIGMVTGFMQAAKLTNDQIGLLLKGLGSQFIYPTRSGKNYNRTYGELSYNLSQARQGKDATAGGNALYQASTTTDISLFGKELKAAFDSKTLNFINNSAVAFSNFNSQVRATNPTLADTNDYLNKGGVQLSAIAKYNILAANGLKLNKDQAYLLTKNIKVLNGEMSIYAGKQMVQKSLQSFIDAQYKKDANIQKERENAYKSRVNQINNEIAAQNRYIKNQNKVIENVQNEKEKRQKLWDKKQQQIQQDQTLNDLAKSVNEAQASGDLIGLALAQSNYNKELKNQSDLKKKEAADAADDKKIKSAENNIKVANNTIEKLNKKLQDAQDWFDKVNGKATTFGKDAEAAVQKVLDKVANGDITDEKTLRGALKNAGLSADEINTSVAKIEKSPEWNNLVKAGKNFSNYVANAGKGFKELLDKNTFLKTLTLAAMSNPNLNPKQRSAAVTQAMKDAGYSKVGGEWKETKETKLKHQVAPKNEQIGYDKDNKKYIYYVKGVSGRTVETGWYAYSGDGKAKEKGVKLWKDKSHEVEYKYATGGFVSGPGTGISDSIPARLSNGEYVMNAKSVSQYGKSFFDKLNFGISSPGTGGILGNNQIWNTIRSVLPIFDRKWWLQTARIYAMRPADLNKAVLSMVPFFGKDWWKLQKQSFNLTDIINIDQLLNPSDLLSDDKVSISQYLTGTLLAKDIVNTAAINQVLPKDLINTLATNQLAPTALIDTSSKIDISKLVTGTGTTSTGTTNVSKVSIDNWKEVQAVDWTKGKPVYLVKSSSSDDVIGQSMSTPLYFLGRTAAATKTDKFATGGYISGPGTGTSDSIPAQLSNGEYVIKASAVSQYGKGFLDAINGQKFANGGLVKNWHASESNIPAEFKLNRIFGGNSIGNALFGFNRILGLYGLPSQAYNDEDIMKSLMYAESWENMNKKPFNWLSRNAKALQPYLNNKTRADQMFGFMQNWLKQYAPTSGGLIGFGNRWGPMQPVVKEDEAGVALARISMTDAKISNIIAIVEKFLKSDGSASKLSQLASDFAKDDSRFGYPAGMYPKWLDTTNWNEVFSSRNLLNKKYAGIPSEIAKKFNLDKYSSIGDLLDLKKSFGLKDGGYISGAGGPTSDMIPAMLSNGEYVIKSSAVSQYGKGMLDAINNKKFATSGLVKNYSIGGKSELGNSSFNDNSVYNINISVDTNANPNEIADAVMRQIQMQQKTLITNRNMGSVR